ncbi:MAG: class I SAM-dependent methyltransferase [Ignavibacteriales bacterium]
MSLDGKDASLYPYLNYLLQDLWELGSSPGEIISLIRQHIKINDSTKVLDLGCGKGAVSVKIAKEFNVRCLGIDAFPDFIRYADSKAKEYHVDNLCEFIIADIRKIIIELSGYDLVILGAVGPVLGNMEATLNWVRRCIRENGYLIIDDAYAGDDKNPYTGTYLKYEEIFPIFAKQSVEIIEEYRPDKDEQKRTDEAMFRSIERRSEELIKLYPGKRNIFEDYIKTQHEEFEILENKVQCVTWILKLLTLAK